MHNPFCCVLACLLALVFLSVMITWITVNISVFCLSIVYFAENVKCSSYIGWLLPITSIYPFFSCILSGFLQAFENKNRGKV